ncbi:MAG: class I SAM-dependent methyltransferase [Asgard group archaeon]|nr:class I SAM-dependent methyltransferase [Asgard group archaeon]
MDKNNSSKVSGLYAVKAHLYTFFTGMLYLIGGVYENKFRRSIYRNCLPKKGNENVLDICCANGKGTLTLSKEFPQGQIDGLDLDPDMVYFANQNTKQYPNINFHVGNCAKIPFTQNQFHVITAWLALHEIPNELVGTVVKEIKRVIKQDGYLLVFDLVLPKKLNFFKRLIFYVFRLFEDESAARYMSIDQGAYLEKFGFKLIKKWDYLTGFVNILLLKEIK